MKAIGQLAVGMVTAFGSSLLVVAAILLSLVEGSTMSAPPTPTRAVNATPVLVINQEPRPEKSPTPTRLVVVVATATEVPQVHCPTPPGWSSYTLAAGDNLEELAARSAVTVEQLREANCLLSSRLLPGTILYLPPAAPSPTGTAGSTATVTPSVTPTRGYAPCRPPRGWVRYQIQPNETLTRISQNFGIRLDQLMAANCLSSSFIMSGTYLYVPNVPTRTPEPEDTPTPTQTPVPVEPTATFTMQPPTQAPATATPTATHTAAPTATPTSTHTEPPVPTETPITPSPPPEEGQTSPTNGAPSP